MQLLSAIVTAAFALCGTALTVFFGNKSQEKNINKSTDVLLYRINKLEEKVENLSKAVYFRRPKAAAGVRQFSVLSRPQAKARQN